MLLLDPWDPVMFRGSHECELCSWEVPPASEDSMALEEELMRTLPPGEERSTRFQSCMLAWVVSAVGRSPSAWATRSFPWGN